MGKHEQKKHFQDLSIDGMIRVKWILKKWWEGMDWTNSAQDRGNWQALVNTAIKLHVP